MKVLVVGSGGREHALAWALARSARLSELHAAPGNPGIASLASCHPVHADDQASLVPLAGELGVDLVVVGPEAPLVVLEGHVRLTAAMLRPDLAPAELSVIVGYSDAITQWSCY